MNSEVNVVGALVQPEVETSKRILDFWMLPDHSKSMAGVRISTLNQAMRECFNELQDVDRMHPEVEMRMRCIAFSNKASWHIGPDPAKISGLAWKDLSAEGCTATGDAIRMLADSVTPDKMPKRGCPPVMVLVSDGANTDGKAYEQAIEQLNKEPWGAKAIRLSIGIGSGYDRKQLEKFSNHPEVGVLEARNAVDLARYIRYATVEASFASMRSSSKAGSLIGNVALPAVPEPVADAENINLQVF